MADSRRNNLAGRLRTLPGRRCRNETLFGRPFKFLLAQPHGGVRLLGTELFEHPKRRRLWLEAGPSHASRNRVASSRLHTLVDSGQLDEKAGS